MGKRRQHSAEFKSRVALEVVQGLKMVNEIVREHEVHPVQVSRCIVVSHPLSYRVQPSLK
jgi:transposase-like protein